jgi:hypothetical protein
MEAHTNTPLITIKNIPSSAANSGAAFPFYWKVGSQPMVSLTLLVSYYKDLCFIKK